MNRKIKLAAPVTARPMPRPVPSPDAPSQRCQSVTPRKNALTPVEPPPKTSPVYELTKRVPSRPKLTSAGAEESERKVTVEGVAPGRASLTLASSVSTGRRWAEGDGGDA